MTECGPRVFGENIPWMPQAFVVTRFLPLETHNFNLSQIRENKENISKIIIKTTKMLPEDDSQHMDL